MTTEYVPNQRDDVAPPPAAKIPETSAPSQHLEQQQGQFDDSVDPNTLPPAIAPPSHNSLDPDAIGTMDGRPIIDVDLSALADKPWRRPGSDLADWFNYGFDELSWEAYCYRRRDIGDLATILKANVLNFSGMNEEQVQSLPPEVRQMVMTGTSAMMNGGMNAGMMGGMDPMGGMGMANMGQMGGMGPMDMGMMMQGQDGTGGPMNVPNGMPDMNMAPDPAMMMGDFMQVCSDISLDVSVPILTQISRTLHRCNSSSRCIPR
jgi:pre-mRNA 3'-end-processing factor FIP1